MLPTGLQPPDVKVLFQKELTTDVGVDESEVRREEQQLTASYQQVNLEISFTVVLRPLLSEF